MAKLAYDHTKKVTQQPIRFLGVPSDGFELDMQRKEDAATEKYRRQLERDQNFNNGMKEIEGDFSRFEGTCSCGKHKAMRFYKRMGGQEVPVSGPLCPLVVFTRRLRDEIRKGNGNEFSRKFDKFKEDFVREA
jgi:hypothetical protein